MTSDSYWSGMVYVRLEADCPQTERPHLLEGFRYDTLVPYNGTIAAPQYMLHVRVGDEAAIIEALRLQPHVVQADYVMVYESKVQTQKKTVKRWAQRTDGKHIAPNGQGDVWMNWLREKNEWWVIDRRKR